MGKERFFKVYANIPINLRKEVILVIDEKPISWDVAYLEIKGDTAIGQKIINSLLKLDII